MASDTIRLPKNKEALARVIDQHAEREESRLSYRRTMWLLAWYYLNGARRFDVFDPAAGALRPHFLDEEGNMEFQSMELLAAIDKVSARLSSMDLRPKVTREGMSLSSIRERSVAQILIDSLVNTDQINKVSTEFAHIFTTLGSCGLAGHVQDLPSIGLTADIEVVHPRELFPFPSLGVDHTKASGLMRQRSVPISFLQERFGRKITQNLKKMEYWEQQVGEHIDTDKDGSEGGVFDYQDSNGDANSPSKDKESMGVVKIRELWTFGVGDLVNRYVVTSGDYVIEDMDLEGIETYCPIGFARFMENGSFHGAGLFDLLFSVNREMERLLKSLFNNIRDIDRYGVLVMPQGQFNERAMLRDVGRGLRVVPFEPDPVGDNFRPFSITPHNAGDVPGRTAAYAKQLMDGLSPVKDLIEEKGRIDSASGLNVLDEEVNKAMTTPSRGMERAFGSCYRAILSAASRVITFSPRPLPVNELTLDLAGAVINPIEGTVDFKENPVPNLSNLMITIKRINPKSLTARKKEAMEWLDKGLTDPDGLKLFSLKEGLDIAVWMDEEKSAYESVIKNCLILYGDGENPGEIVLTPHTAKPSFQMRVLTSFMTGPSMTYASPEVQDEFMKYREFLMHSLGLTLPKAVPSPDDMAVLMDAQRQANDIVGKAQMQAGGPQGGGPPPQGAAPPMPTPR